MSIKGKLEAAALAFGLYHLAAPEVQELDDNKSYAPNAIQQEFMKLAAQKYDYLALGDTSHRRQEMALFALSDETVKAVSDGGDENYFLEYIVISIKNKTLRVFPPLFLWACLPCVFSWRQRTVQSG